MPGPTVETRHSAVRGSKEHDMSTLTDRPNTALVVIDVQNGVVGERPRPRRGRGQREDGSSTRRARPASPSSGCSTTTTTCPRAATAGSTSTSCDPAGVRGAGAQVLRRLLRGHRPRGRAGRRGGRPAGGGRRADRRVHPLHHPRRLHARLRRHPRRRRPHHRGPQRVRRPDAGQGDRPHQPLLEVRRGSRSRGRCGQDRGAQLPARRPGGSRSLRRGPRAGSRRCAP